MKHPLCCIFNHPSIYRLPIYQLMEEKLDAEFYFGKDRTISVKKFNYSELKGFKGELTVHKIKNLKYEVGAISLLSKYNSFMLVGEPHSISTWSVLLLGKLLNKQVCLWSHGWYGREGKLKKIIKKAFFGLAAHTFLYGEYAQNLMVKEGFDKKKLHAIYNSLDYDTQIVIREELKKTPLYKDYFKNEYPTLLFIGRLTKVKKLDMILQAIKLLEEDNIKVNCTFIGTGECKEELQELAKALNISERIWMYGESYSEKEVSTLLYNADVCVSPGNVGLTAIHALTYGCPVITHNDFTMQMPEFEAIQDGKSGLFFENGDTISLTATIKRWLETNGKTREKVRKDCYQIVDEKFNPHNQIEIFKKILKK